jgi:hypothetical protein
MADRSVARPLPKHITTQTQNKRTHTHTHTHIHASSGTRTHDPSVRASEDSLWLRPRGHYDRQFLILFTEIIADYYEGLTKSINILVLKQVVCRR